MKKSLPSKPTTKKSKHAPQPRRERSEPAVENDRLQKRIAASGICSRRRAEELIVAGRVLVNGRPVTTLGAKAGPSDVVLVDGRPLSTPERRLYLFHKPRGILTTMRDPFKRPTLRPFLRDLPVRVFPVGRLDNDVSGLLLLTNDGEYAERLLHPRNQMERVYWARCRGRIDPAELGRLIRGVDLEDGVARAARARRLRRNNAVIEALGTFGPEEDALELVVKEGRKHFVKRLLAAWGHPVQRLIRVGFGPYVLGNLPPGAIKEVKKLPQSGR